MNAPARTGARLGIFTVTLGDLAFIAIAVFVALAYFNGWGGH